MGWGSLPRIMTAFSRDANRRFRSS
jgi:catechol 2,3-dioxygenase-like lactoylglutathione lyase family enzyme